MTATQIQFRRGSAAQMATFTGAVGEVVVDTTNQRTVVHDGATAGGWPVALSVRTAVADTTYTAKITDRIVAYTSLTAARTVSLPAAANYPTGEKLTIVDESGNCSASKAITVSRAGSDTINGATAKVVNAAYGYVTLESNGSSAWAVVGQDINSAMLSWIATLPTTLPGTTGTPWNDGGVISTT